MTNLAFLKLTKEEQIKAKKARKQYHRERVVAGQAKSAQPRKRVANKMDSGVVTRKMDRHWKCGCVIKHRGGGVWEQAVVCNQHQARVRELVEGNKVQQVKAAEIAGKLSVGSK